MKPYRTGSHGSLQDAHRRSRGEKARENGNSDSECTGGWRRRTESCRRQPVRTSRTSLLRLMAQGFMDYSFTVSGCRFRILVCVAEGSRQRIQAPRCYCLSPKGLWFKALGWGLMAWGLGTNVLILALHAGPLLWASTRGLRLKYSLENAIVYSSRNESSCGFLIGK